MRRNRFAVPLLMCVCILSPVFASAQNDIAESGNNFLAMCSAIDKAQDRWDEVDFLHLGVCQGYMEGLQEGIGLAFSFVKKGEGSLEDLGVCFPSGGTVTTEQMTRVVLKYIKDNPEKAHQRTATLVVLAGKNAFPCAAQKR